MSDLGFEFGTAPARTREGGPRKRSERQQRVDTIVSALVDAWEKAGSPSASHEKPAYREVFTSEDEYNTLLKEYRSAGTFLGVSVRFYDYEGSEPGPYALPISAETKREYKPRKKTADSGE